MLTINSSTVFFPGNTVQPNAALPSLDNHNTNSSSHDKDSTTDTTASSTKTGQSQIDQEYQEYQDKKIRLDQKHDRESAQLEKAYMRAKKKIDQEYRQKTNSMAINIYV